MEEELRKLDIILKTIKKYMPQTREQIEDLERCEKEWTRRIKNGEKAQTIADEQLSNIAFELKRRREHNYSNSN